MAEAPLALVTGAAGGIGLEVSRRLVRRGFRIVAVEVSRELADRAVETIGNETIGVVTDLADRGAVRELCARVEGEWADGLEVVLCNAGVIVPGDVADSAAEQLDRQIDVMLLSAMQLSAAAARVFRAKGRGHLLATVSMGGIIALPGSAAYSAAKAGLRAFLSGLAAELRGTGVVVTGVYPSAVDTPMLRFEATHEGSLLNFVGAVSTAGQVADRFERALDRPRLEVYLPYADSLFSKLVQAWPWLLPRLLPLMNALGERGRKRYLASTFGEAFGRDPEDAG